MPRERYEDDIEENSRNRPRSYRRRSPYESSEERSRRSDEQYSSPQPRNEYGRFPTYDDRGRGQYERMGGPRYEDNERRGSFREMNNPRRGEINDSYGRYQERHAWDRQGERLRERPPGDRERGERERIGESRSPYGDYYRGQSGRYERDLRDYEDRDPYYNTGRMDEWEDEEDEVRDYSGRNYSREAWERARRTRGGQH